ncbi:hypothetical protein [Thiohalocapsa sp. ML1]|uniref:hypothetical protein n=1 Tax=Thiohalocapsa sp. ML1 TaxID=1431688 RepID=UPI00073240E4|nr:hypothetical protein [Thiohalocapsa sp. ML1]
MRDNPGRVHTLRASAVALIAALLGGCALPTAPGGGDTGLRVEIRRPVPLPAGSAHANFQFGRVVRGTNLFEPFCQLEANLVAPERRDLLPGAYRVSRVGNRLLRDAITRIPAVYPTFDCSDGVFQESRWRLAPASAEATTDVRELRCIAPYYNCTFGPPLSVDQVQLVVGDYLGIAVADATAD